jgi:hypothetical protein
VEVHGENDDDTFVAVSVVMLTMKILDDSDKWNREGHCETGGVEWWLRVRREDYRGLFERQWNLVSDCSRRATA